MSLALINFQIIFCFSVLVFHSLKAQCGREGFKGENCQYMCHCRDGNKACQEDGSCTGECSKGFMGAKCQHVVIGHWKAEDLDIDDKSSVSCNHNMKKIIVKFSEPQPFLWMHVWTKAGVPETDKAEDASAIRVVVDDGYIQCSLPQFATVSDNVFALHCLNVEKPSKVLKFGGELIKDWCQIKVGGGRNFALNQETSQSLSGKGSAQGTEASVDGDPAVKDDCNVARGDDNTTIVEWKLELRDPIDVYKIKVVSSAEIVPQPLSNLQVELYEGNRGVYVQDADVGQEVDSHTIPLTLVRNVSTVILKRTGSLALCEVELYGDCPKGWFGDCGASQMCQCGNSREICSQETGECASGCGPGYVGDHCGTACPNGTYGNECSQSCESACKEAQCSNVDGSCLLGCVDATMSPPLCRMPYAEGSKTGGEGEGGTTQMVMMVLPLLLIVGVLVAAAIMQFKKRRAEKKIAADGTVLEGEDDVDEEATSGLGSVIPSKASSMIVDGEDYDEEGGSRHPSGDSDESDSSSDESQE